MSQLHSSLRDYQYEDPDVEQAKKGEDRRSVSRAQHDDGLFRLHAKLDADEGAVVNRALEAALEDLRRQAREDAPEGEQPRRVTLADAMVAMAEALLRAGEAKFPGSDRYLVHLHLDANRVDGDTTTLGFHLGGPVPEALRSLLLCGDTVLQPTFWDGTSPLSVGRKTRSIDRKLHRVIEHRDGGCRVPGCGRTHGLEIHHIAHWEHGGATDTKNLVTLCKLHHRTHHLGLLGVTGNPEHPESAQPPPPTQDTLDSQDGWGGVGAGLLGTAEGPLRFTDQWGRPLDPSGTPIRPAPGQSIEQAAEAIDAAPTAVYAHPYGERLQRDAVFFSRNDLRFPGQQPKPAPAPPTDQDPAATSPDPPPTGPNHRNSRTGADTTWSGPGDPRHGGPPTSSSPPAA